MDPDNEKHSNSVLSTGNDPENPSSPEEEKT